MYQRRPRFQRGPRRPRQGGRPAPPSFSLTGLVEFVAYGLVRDVEAVRVREVVRPQVVVYELRVADDDKGRVIGKDGRIAQALRTVMRAAAGNTERRIVLDIV